MTTDGVKLSFGKKVESGDVYWLEEPVAAEDFAGYFRIADALNIRIVGGESHFTRYDLRPFFENPKIPVLQPDVMRGGLTELRKRMPHTNLTEFEKDPDINKMADLFTVNAIVNYIENKLNEA